MKHALPTDQMRRMTVPFEVKSVEEAPDSQFAGSFSGYAAGIHNIDRAGDMILPGAFAETMADFLKDGVVCWQHDWMTPIGTPVEAREDAYGLWSKCRVSATTQGKDAMTLIRDGVVKKLSIGYRVKAYERVDRAGLISYLKGCGLADQKQQAIVAQYDEMELDELYLLKKIKLYEYSPVTVPANPNAMITDAKSLLAGLSFSDQLLAVRDAVKEVVTRASQIKGLRESEGRKLSDERLKLLQDVAGDLQGLTADIEGLAKQSAPEPNQDAMAEYAKFLQMEARALGAA